MALPTYNVYINFGAGSQVDVTSYTNSINIQRGSSRMFDDTQPGTITISFNNFDRTFDPFNTSSMLWDSTNGYTKVQPNAKVTVYANGGQVFTGWVNTWSFTNDEKGLNPQASLTATDGLGILGNAHFNPVNVSSFNLPSMPPIRIAAATAAWGSTSITVSQAGSAGRTPLVADLFDQNATVLSYLQNVARTEPYNFFGTKDGNAKFTDRTLTGRTWGTASISYNYHATAGFYGGTATNFGAYWNSWYPSATANKYVIVSGSNGDSNYIQSPPDPSFAQTELTYYETDATKWKANQAYSVSFRGQYVDSLTYMSLAFYYKGVRKVITQISGTATGSDWALYTIPNVSSTATIDTIQFQVYNANAAIFNIKDLIITATTSASSSYFDGNNFQQVNDFLNEQQVVNVGWVGQEYLSTSIQNTSINGGGTVNLPAYEVFGDAYGTAVIGTAIPISDLQVAYNVDQFYNQVNVVRASGGTATKNNSVSQSFYGVRTYAQTDSLSISPARSTAFASEVMAQFGFPDYVLTEVDVQIEALSTAYQNRVLALELFDIVRVIFRPYGGGSNIDRTYQIINIQHNIGLESHVINFGLASVNSGLYLNSIYLGVLDTQKVV